MSVEYRDLPKFAGKLKLAAIDAYISSSSSFSLDKSSNYYVLSGKLRSLDMNISMSRPNTDGTRGGEFASPKWIGHSGYRGLFGQIRRRVDKIIKPQMDLPNPYSDSFNGKINKYREKVTAVLPETFIEGLDPTTKTTDVSTVKLQSFDKIVPGRMKTLLKGMNDCAPALEGSTFSTFRATFVASMPSAIGNLVLLAHVHGETLPVEQLFPKQLRKKVAKTVEKVADAFEEIAREEDGVSFNMPLNILVWDYMAATIPGEEAVATARLAGDVSVPLAVPKDIRSLKGSKTVKKATLEADNFREVVKEFKRVFERIGDDFKAAEEAVDENLRYNIRLVLEDRACRGHTDTSFHLALVLIQNAAGTTRMNENAVSQMTVDDGATGGYVSQTAAKPERAVKALVGISMVDLVRHKHNIGMGSTGPGGTFAELRQVLHELLQNLRWKVDEGNINLRIAMRDLQGSDASSWKALDAIASNVVQGSGMDLWDHKRQRGENLRPHGSGNV